MIVADYNVRLDSSHDLSKYHHKEESLVTWTGGEKAQEAAYRKPVDVSLSPEALKSVEKERATQDGLAVINDTDKLQSIFSEFIDSGPNLDSPVKVDFSDRALEYMNATQVKVKNTSGLPANEKMPLTEEELQVDLIEKLFYSLTGKKLKIKLLTAEDLEGNSKEKISRVHEMAVKKSKELNLKLNIQGEDEPERVGWGLDYQYHEVNYERETTTFDAQGIVKTADGREIHLDVAMRMSRELIQETHLSVKAGDALIDPLVINYGGNAADLSDTKFQFDLDMDGSKDEISMLKRGSGYLALDKNGDGAINDGSELFGPQSGSGFQELAQYDEDGNGWIDENDSVFQDLKVWTTDYNGNQKLLGIAQVGVGAIYLDNAKTEFDLTSDDGRLNGKVRETGIYLNEDGSVGTVQEIDLVV